MNRLFNTHHAMLVNLRRLCRASRRRQLVAVGLSWALVLVPLLGTQTFTAAARTLAAPAPPAAPVQITRRGAGSIIQDPAYDDNAVAEMEDRVINKLLALHKLPTSDRAQLLGWERDLIRAGLFNEIMGIFRKARNEVTPNEYLLVERLVFSVMQRRAEAARIALAEYRRWESNPCTYAAPAGFPRYDRPCSCFSHLCGLFGGPKPPSFESFQAYGAAAVFRQFQTDLVAQQVAANTARNMNLLFGMATAIGAGVVGGAVGFAGLGLAIVYSLHPVLLTLVGSSASASGSVLASAAAPSFSVGLGGSIAIIVAAVVIATFEGIAVVEAAELPGKLQAAYDNAIYARDHITDAQVTLRNIIAPEGGPQNLFYELLAATLPDYPATTGVPPQEPADPKFLLAPGDTVEPALKYQDWEGKPHTARLSGGWFVDKKENEAERLTLSINYIDHNGVGRIAARRGASFVHSVPGNGFDARHFESPEIKFKDWNGAPATASISVPDFDIAPLPVVAIKDVPVARTIAHINLASGQSPNLTFAVNGGASATDKGITISELRMSGSQLRALVSATCTAEPATFTVTVSDSGNTRQTPISVTPTGLIFDDFLPYRVPNSPIGDPYAFSFQSEYKGACHSAPVVSISEGRLPPGLTLTTGNPACDGNGNCSLTTTVQGTPTSGGRYDFTLKLAFAGGETVSRNYNINISSQAAEISFGLVSWWRGEGDSLDAKFNNSARPNNPEGTLKFAAGKVGRGFHFNGSLSDSLLLPNTTFPAPPFTETNDQFTFETWFKTKPATDFIADTHVILGQENADGTNGLPALYVGNDGKLRAQLFSTGSINPITSTVRVDDGFFHHIAVTFDRSVQWVYLDGELIGANYSFRPVGYASEYRYRLGAGRTEGWPAASVSLSPIYGYAFFDGVIDEAAVYNYALSPFEVRRIFAAGSAGKIAIETYAFTACNGGAIYVVAQSPFNPLTYAVDDGEFQEGIVLENLTPGNHTVKIKDANGTIFTRTETVPEPDSRISPGSRTLDASGGSGTFTVSNGLLCTWSAVSDNPDFITVGNASGRSGESVSYTVAPNPTATARTGTITVDTGQGSLRFNIRQDGRPTATVSGGGAVCPGGSATVSVNLTGGVAPYTVTLTNGGGTKTSSTLPITFAVSPTATTTYAVQSATDANGTPAVATGSATVTTDNIKPVINAPAPITVDGNRSGGATVAFTVTATDNCGSPTLSLSKPSGSFFPFGTTTVTATATDRSGNSSQSSFTVTVRTLQQQVASINAQVQALVTAGTLTPEQGAGLSDKLTQVTAELNQGQTRAACNQLNAFANQVNGFVNARKLTAAQGQSLVNAANALKTNIGCS